MVARTEEAVGRLSAADPRDRLEAARAIKNAVIGNSKKKVQYLEAGAVPALLALAGTSSEAAPRVQALAALGSLAARPEGARAIVDARGLEAFIAVLRSDQDELRAAAVHALKGLAKVRREERRARERGREEEAERRLRDRRRGRGWEKEGAEGGGLRRRRRGAESESQGVRASEGRNLGEG